MPVDPRPNTKDDFAFVQTVKSGARPISRKEKVSDEARPFETAHKLPLSLTFALNEENEENDKSTKQKRAASPDAPAPAGAIRLDPLKLIQKYKAELKTSSTEAPKVTSKTTKKRIKKEVETTPTSPRPSLTSGAPPTPRTLDLDGAPLVGSSSNDKQRSRIQVKKGPNGQEYEYEYVYYYYDDDEEKSKSTTQKVHNSHDGPGRREKPASSNEVIPNGRGRGRGRQLEEEESVGEDRLPPSTRFPPRGRNFASSQENDDDSKASSRERGRASAKSDNSSEESQVSRHHRNSTRTQN